jgi:hypothetical protein
MSLSQYSPLDSLLDLACRDGVDIRPTLLRVITDLYVQKPTHSGEEEKQYVELALGLIDAVDEATRATVAARLAGYPGAPQTVLSKLELAPTSTGAETPPPVASGQRAPDLIEDFFSATPAERQLILTNLAPLDTAVMTLPPAPADTINRLESAALKHNMREFTRVLERALGVGPTLAARIVHDPSGEPIVVAAKALGMKGAVLQRILLMLNPAIGQSVERVFSLALLYDEISTAAAAQMVSGWRRSAAPPKPRHMPAYWDDERGRSRTGAAAERRRAPRNSAPAPAQSRTGER